MSPKRNDDAPLFREFEHTGDVGIELNAPSRAGLFRRACVALASLLVKTSDVERSEKRTVRVQAETDSDLMHDLLTELLCLFTVENFIWRDASVREDHGSLRVTLEGEHFDPSRHSFRGEIKAVTYHELAVTNSSKGWRARVIFDV
ncbi:MAG: archease [Candidatus Binatus sp.]